MIEWFRSLAVFETISILIAGTLFSAILLWGDKPRIYRLFQKKSETPLFT